MGTFTLGNDNATDDTYYSTYVSDPTHGRFFVDPDLGNDSTGTVNDPTKPFKNASTCGQIIYNNLPSLCEAHVLIKKGTVVNEGNNNLAPQGGDFHQKSGLSLTQPILYGCYDPSNPFVFNPRTGGPRPIILSVGGNSVFNLVGLITPVNNFGVFGWDIYAPEKDMFNTAGFHGVAYNPALNDAGVHGIYIQVMFNWFLMEDVRHRFCFSSTEHNQLDNAVGFPAGTCKIRRCSTHDNWKAPDANVNGGYFAGLNLVDVSQSVWDHNGWTEYYGGASGWQGAVGTSSTSNDNRTYYDHNFYSHIPQDGTGANVGKKSQCVVSFSNTIFSRDAASSQFRSTCHLDDFLSIGAPIAHQLLCPFDTHIRNSVYQNDIKSGGRRYEDGLDWTSTTDWNNGALAETIGRGNGPGMPDAYVATDFTMQGSIDLSDNILCHTLNAGAGHPLYLSTGMPSGKITVSRNVGWKWLCPIGGVETQFRNTAGVTYDSNEWEDSNLQGTSNVHNYPDPDRNMDRYMAEVIGTPVPVPGEGIKQFMAVAREMYRATWDSRFTANAYNNFIRAGFGKAAYPSGSIPAPVPAPIPAPSPTPPAASLGLTPTTPAPSPAPAPAPAPGKGRGKNKFTTILDWIKGHFVNLLAFA